ncbi:regulator of chromosome condensation 1/beta-lactamase-inhibitor protein II [Scheffersomyces amazonensis]|uniref:regulator of chromosome condensation 1/beta-lactamase-inhibitor protein II n=1 Tax=Scheffersomyces amazonensis TaxID=1078765 RepID=UPI00315C8FDE
MLSRRTIGFLRSSGSGRICRQLLISCRNYSSLDDFNKNKTHYTYGQNFKSLEDLEKDINAESTSKKIHERIQKQLEEEEQEQFDSIIRNDPRLVGLEPGSPEFKEQLHLVQISFQEEQKKQQKKYEFYERLRGLAVGVFALVTIIGGHQLYMNYPYVKTKLLANINYKIDEEKAPDLTDPAKNTKKSDYLVTKLAEELNSVRNVQNSHEISGLYIVGESNNSKLPIRLEFFNDMLIKDVKILKDYLIVVTDNGQVYHYHKGLEKPALVNLPFKIDEAQVSNDLIYLKTTKGDIIYFPRDDKSIEFEGIKRRNWLGISQSQIYQNLNVGESIQQFSTGENHILLLTKSGKLFIANTKSNPNNYGQYGLPQLSPYSDNKSFPVNQPFEMVLLNNEIIHNKDGSKILLPRKFVTIASGKYHNIAVDSKSNVWTWGFNKSGECGIPITINTDIQPVPKQILQLSDLKRICRNVLPSSSTIEGFSIVKALAGDNSSYILVKNHEFNQDILLSFGSGIKGQLGDNRYLHVCPNPQIMKSLMNLTEYDENQGKVINIGIKDISVGNNHLFVTLNNSGLYKEVVVIGDNESGQFGNGKVIKSAKPIKIPQLIEPEDLKDDKSINNKKLSKKLNDINNNRLQLLDDHKLNSKIEIEQVIVAGDNGSAIFYRRK